MFCHGFAMMFSSIAAAWSLAAMGGAAPHTPPPAFLKKSEAKNFICAARSSLQRPVAILRHIFEKIPENVSLRTSSPASRGTVLISFPPIDTRNSPT